MKIGVCTGYDNATLAKELGFAYLEPQVSATAAMTDEDFAAVCDQMKKLDLPMPVFNVLFPGDMRLLDGTLTDEALTAYLHHAFARVKQLGGERVVFGSGRARMRPEHVSYADAFRELVRVTRVIGNVAVQYGLTIVVEPLNRQECNMINSVGEGACLMAAVDHPNVKLLADHYHMALDGEPADDIIRAGGVQHAHIAAKVGRLYPMEADSEIMGFIRALKASGYDALLSVEGRTQDMVKDAPAAIAALSEVWRNA